MSNSRADIPVQAIPACLRERAQWVVWRYVERGGKPTKCPLDAKSGAMADSTKATTWSSFEQAIEVFETDQRNEGIGFVFAADDPYCGIDLDDCVNPSTGELKPWGQEFIELLDSYSEISPSGTGVKVFIEGIKPGERCRRGYHDGEVELYDRARFFTVTGQVLPGGNHDVAARQAELEVLYSRVFGSAHDDVGIGAGQLDLTAPAALEDDQILEIANRSRSGAKFQELWSGTWQSSFPSQSEADSSLMFMLAFYTKDPSQLDRLFRRCHLMRDKWDQKHGATTYGQMTIGKAIAKVAGQWQPGDARRQRAMVRNTNFCSEWKPTHLTQQVNAERLVQVLAGNARYNVNKGAWVWYDGQRFTDDHVGRVTRAAKHVARQTWDLARDGQSGLETKIVIKHAIDSEKAAGIAAMMKLAETEEGIPARTCDFDANSHLFNCENGTINLQTGVLEPHDRDDLLTKAAPLRYEPACPRPLFDAFLKRIMGGNQIMVDYLCRVLGRCLSGDVSEQELYFFIGEGANGKSVLIDTVLGILGDYAGTAPESLLTVQSHNEHPTEIADLCGKRLVVASETEEGAKLKVQLVKRLTGDGRIKGRFMRQDFFEFDRTHKTIIVSNNKPLIRETKHAIWRRIRLVPFSVIIPEAERDAQLTEKLKAEWPGILAWLVEGYQDWCERGMCTPTEVLMATQDYQKEQDPLGDYVTDRCVVEASAKISRNDLFADYASWCSQVGDKFPLSRNALFDHIRSVKGVAEDTWRSVGHTAPIRGFKGLKLAYCNTSVADLKQ
jgi:putative DNA primase/helicase